MEDIQIRQINKGDLKDARRFAAEGMNMSNYVSNKLELYLYSLYILYLELSKSTVALGAYYKGKLVGFLFARFKGEALIFKDWKYSLLVGLGEKIINLSAQSQMAEMYDKANKEMFDRLTNENPDGEITFFATDPKLNGRGVGSRLLKALEDHRRGRLVYLYTDSECNYPFYLKRGFNIFDSKEILMEAPDGELPLTCYIMTKKFIEDEDR